MATLLVVSPHLDDACLSYGAQIRKHVDAGHKVVVYTAFAGTPTPPYSEVASKFHDMWALEGDPMAPRRQEDLEAMRHVGAEPLHGTFLDGIYRRGCDGHWLVQPGAKPHCAEVTEEPELIEQIATVIEKLVAEHEPIMMATAAAVGHHMDHQRVRDAAIIAAQRTATQVQLWEDQPYARWTQEMPPLPAGTTLGAPMAVAASASARTAKFNAVACYASQLEMLVFRGSSIFDLLDQRSAALTTEVPGDGYVEQVWSVDLDVNGR
jgi:LmbE family N-acetylglucosaminyl deacetylase